MAIIRSHSIISPLGSTTEANYQAVREGRSAIQRYEGKWGLPQPFAASLMDNCDFDTLCLQVLQQAADEANIDLADERLLLILSSTKGNIPPLAEANPLEEQILLGNSARRLQQAVQNPNTPLCVCNACISGTDAQIEALRYLETDLFDRVAVVGADLQCPFIVSGFLSLLVVSDEPCRPFDGERIGLNPGDAAACIIYEREGLSEGNFWHTDLNHTAIRNDAFHISGPSRSGEGCYQAIKSALHGFEPEKIGVICAHGTATMFNDEMESIAIQRAGLEQVPVNGLKGYYGHTMGASGVLETILTLRALEDGVILSTRGFQEQGTSQALCISADERHTDLRTALKIISGFGGSNAAMLFWQGKTPELHAIPDSSAEQQSMGSRATRSALSRQLLANAPQQEPDCIVLFSRLGSWDTDLRYQQTIQLPDNYFPSPSLFIYTLPNIVTGELAIHYGRPIETSLILLPERDEALMERHIKLLLREHKTVLSGWLEDGKLKLYE